MLVCMFVCTVLLLKASFIDMKEQFDKKNHCVEYSVVYFELFIN